MEPVFIRLPRSKEWIVRFNIGDIVYSITDIDQKPGMITEINLTANGGVTYIVQRDTIRCVFYGEELSTEKSFNF